MGVLGMLGVVLDSNLVGHNHDHTNLVSRGEAYVGSLEVVGGGIADSVACGMDEAAVQRQFASLLDPDMGETGHSVQMSLVGAGGRARCCVVGSCQLFENTRQQQEKISNRKEGVWLSLLAGAWTWR